MTKPKLRVHHLLPAIAAIAFGCAHQPGAVTPPTDPSAVQSTADQATAPDAGTNDYSVQAWSGKKGGNWGGKKGGGGGWDRHQGGNKGGGGGWDHHQGNRDHGGNWGGNHGGGGGGGNYGHNRGGWSDRHGGHHSYAYGHHWTHNYGWWGHNYRYDTAGWWGGGNWWTYGGVPWWGLGYEPAWLATASLAQSQFVYLNGFYYPFYYVGGTIYPDYSRPFVYNGYTYVPYSGANLMVPNQGESLPVSNAQIVNAPVGVTD